MTHALGSIRRRTLTGGLLVALLCMTTIAHAADLDVRIVDDRISISASAVPLVELLAALDAVAGTESSVAVELRNRNVSVQFSGLSLDNALDKVFEGLGLDFLVVGRTKDHGDRRVRRTGRSYPGFFEWPRNRRVIDPSAPRRTGGAHESIPGARLPGTGRSAERGTAKGHSDAVRSHRLSTERGTAKGHSDAVRSHLCARTGDNAARWRADRRWGLPDTGNPG